MSGLAVTYINALAAQVAAERDLRGVDAMITGIRTDPETSKALHERRNRLLAVLGRIQSIREQFEEKALAQELSDLGCQGPGTCHGCLKWCDLCGDVSATCDASACDIHQEDENDGAKDHNRPD